MDREAIFYTLHAHQNELASRGVQSLAVFGSVAHGDEFPQGRGVGDNARGSILVEVSGLDGQGRSRYQAGFIYFQADGFVQ